MYIETHSHLSKKKEIDLYINIAVLKHEWKMECKPHCSLNRKIIKLKKTKQKNMPLSQVMNFNSKYAVKFGML